MKRITLLMLVLGSSVMVAMGAGKARDAEEFGKLMKDCYAAWSTLDPDNAAKFYARDADLVFYDIAPLKYDGGWQQYRDNFKNNVAPTFATLVIAAKDDLKVTRQGKIAWTTLTFHVAAKMKDGSPMEFDGRHTLIWERRHGQWLIVHEHVSKPL